MPIPPPSGLPPYDTLESVLNLARTRLNDAIQTIGGDILTDSQPFTATMTNGAWRNLQAFLANMGYMRFKRKAWLYGLPIVASTDPSVFTQLTWTYFFDGVSYYYVPFITALPFDLICPLRIGERQTGSLQPFRPMCMAPDGLYENQKIPWNRQFEWKFDTIYMPGSTFSMDLEIEYAAYDADFVAVNNVLGDPTTSPVTTPSNMQVPIMRCQSSFANYLCAEMAVGRDDVDVNAFIAAAEKDAKLVMNNEVKLKQRTPIQRRAYGGRRRGGQFFRTYGY